MKTIICLLMFTCSTTVFALNSDLLNKALYESMQARDEVRKTYSTRPESEKSLVQSVSEDSKLKIEIGIKDGDSGSGSEQGLRFHEETKDNTAKNLDNELHEMDRNLADTMAEIGH